MPEKDRAFAELFTNGTTLARVICERVRLKALDSGRELPPDEAEKLVKTLVKLVDLTISAKLHEPMQDG